MKAFKLASAFAVTGLALAVSGQAMAADTTTDWTWGGEIVFSADVMNNAGGGSAGTRGSNGDSNDALNVAIAVANGGFSATMAIEADTDSSYAGSISVDDFVYEEGAISFGMLSSMNSTEGYIDGMKDDLSYTVDRAFRYTMDNGFAVQAQGGVTWVDDTQTTSTSTILAASDMGVAVAYTGEFEGGSFAVDVEYAESGATFVGSSITGVDTTDTALEMYTGFGVTMAASDAVSVSAAYTKGINAVSSMGVRADYTADAFTAYLSWVDEATTLGGTASVGAIDLSADYAVTGSVLDLGASTAGESGAMSYTASLDMADVTNNGGYDAAVGVAFAASDMMVYSAGYETDGTVNVMTAGATYTTEGGATLALDYTNDNTVGDEVDTLVATASYSF